MRASPSGKAFGPQEHGEKLPCGQCGHPRSVEAGAGRGAEGGAAPPPPSAVGGASAAAQTQRGPQGVMSHGPGWADIDPSTSPSTSRI